MSSSDLRVAVVGTGMMGADHVSRITNKISGAQVTAVVDPDVSRAEAAAALAPGAGIFDSLQAAIDSGAIDAVVIATGGLSELIVPLSIEIDEHDPTLTLAGLRMVHELNAAKASG